MRRLTVPGILILLVTLAGCTPPDEPIVALAVDDGQPMGVLVTCDSGFSLLGVYENDEDTTTHISWLVSGTPASEVVEVPLLGSPPEGWEVEEPRELPGSEGGVTIKIEQLTELKPGVRYGLHGSSGRDAMTVGFTTSDFARVGPDEVLAPEDRDTVKVMSRKAFVRKARDSCD